MGLIISARDMASQVFARVERALGSMGVSATRVAASVAGVYAGYRGMQAGLDLIKGSFELAEGAGKFQEKLAHLSATAEVGAEGMEEFRRKAVQMGLSTRFDPSQAVDSMTALAAAGESAKDAITGADIALKLSAISLGKLSTDEAAGFLTSVKKMFPGEDDFERIANIAGRVAMDTWATIEQLPGMFSRVARGASYRQTLAETAATIGIMKDVTQSAETAATTVGEVFANMALGSKGSKFMKVTGVQLRDANDEFRPFLQVMSEWAESPLWMSMDKAAKNDFIFKMFGKRQMAVVDALFKRLEKGVEVDGKIIKGAEGMRALVATMEDAKNEDVLGQFEGRRLKTFGEQLAQLQAKVTTFKDTIFGEAFAQAFYPVFKVLNKFLEMAGYLADLVPAQVKVAIAAFVLLGAGIFTVTALTGGLIVGFLLLKAVILGTFGAFMSSWGLLAIPIIAVVGAALIKFLIIPLAVAAVAMAGLALIGLGLFVAWKYNIGGFGDSLRGIISQVSLVFNAMKQLFTQNGRMTEAMWDTLNKPENSGALSWVRQLWIWFERIRNFARGIWQGFKEGLTAADGPLRFFKESILSVLNLFDLAAGSASDNRSAFERWGEAGKKVGLVFAEIVNFGLILAGVLVHIVGAVLTLVQHINSAFNMIGGAGTVGKAWFQGLSGDFGGAAITLYKGFGTDEATDTRGALMSTLTGGPNPQLARPAVAAQASTNAAIASSPAKAGPVAPIRLESHHHTRIQVREATLGEAVSNHQRDIAGRMFQPTPVPGGRR
jgi:TP901 family phage tail tape measure protein